ncbi:acyl carrier protein [Actinomadura roseirufa]|uniref:acyl carrier protein n=1 Tax=Actinomadura roseirufa TaxID=2094049 RepID=UPI001A9544EF|nr:acyl carrier protein [Actinomadura roseirufa]
MTARDFLIGYIADSWMDGDAAGLHEDTPLIELNIIDSAAIFDLVHSLQDEFGVAVPLREITPANFRSVGAITALLGRLEREEKSVR